MKGKGKAQGKEKENNKVEQDGTGAARSSEQHARRPHDLEDSGFKRQHPNPTRTRHVKDSLRSPTNCG